MAKKRGNKKKKDDADVSDVLAEKMAALSFNPLRRPSSAAENKPFVRPKSGSSSKLVADPIDLMQKQRIENIGHLEAAAEGVTSGGFRKEEKKNKSGARQTEILSVGFPPEYAYLLKLPKLNEPTLRRYPKLWGLIMSRPQSTAELIRKETALIALNWAQELLDIQKPAIVGAFLSMDQVQREKGKKNKQPSSTVFFILTRPPKKKVTGEKEKKQEEDSSVGYLRKGSIVKLVPIGRYSGTEIPFARVVKLAQEEVVVKIRVPNPQDVQTVDELLKITNQIRQVDVFEVHSDFVPRAMLRSIERLKRGTCDHILQPAPKYKRGKAQYEKELAEIQPSLSAFSGLNDRQTRVLYSICTSAHVDAPYVLHGPPGTGKTRVIAATVRCLMEMDPSFRILLTAPSNMAADMIAHKLMENFDGKVMNRRNVLRLRSTGNDFASRDRRLDPIMCFDEREGAFTIPAAKDLALYRVIICTLGCSAHLVMQLLPGQFSHIFLDEAGQASEGEIWIPIGGLATGTTSIVFCGDDRQLGPVCTLDLSKQISDQFESPLVRYMNLSLYKEDKRLMGVLNRSYRCHGSILSIASEMFYSKQLISGTGERMEPFVQWTGLCNKEFPMMFVSVRGQEIMESKSYGNQAEIVVVLEYLRRLIANFPALKPEDIGVISPYRYQTHLLTKELIESDIPGREKITVDSVERFQGSERKVIIITTTRTDKLGFVACNKRLNTSITRAMNLLLVVGNERALSQHSSWKRFLDYAVENNAFIKWDEDHKTKSNALPTASPRFTNRKNKVGVHRKGDWRAKKIANKRRQSGHRTHDPPTKLLNTQQKQSSSSFSFRNTFIGQMVQSIIDAILAAYGFKK